MSFWPLLSAQIALYTGMPFKLQYKQAISSGCINQAYTISDGSRNFFVKLNSTQFGDMFEAEALALNEMASSGCIKVPQAVCFGNIGNQAYLVMEQLTLSGRVDSVKQGQQLACMHKVSAPLFGWHRHNTIGSTPQLNTQSANWINFWREQRLLPQLQLAQRNGHTLAPVEQLVANFDCLFENHQPQPSMLHGDLWGGNAAALVDGTPVLFDPAFYYGDREADIAMTHLFGGFNTDFYAAYNEAWPLHVGHEVRRTFYNLYHIINHLNLFGAGYLQQSLSMAEQVLAEIR